MVEDARVSKEAKKNGNVFVMTLQPDQTEKDVDDKLTPEMSKAISRIHKLTALLENFTSVESFVTFADADPLSLSYVERQMMEKIVAKLKKQLFAEG